LTPDKSLSLTVDHIKIFLQKIEQFRQTAYLDDDDIRILQNLSTILIISCLEDPDDHIDKDKKGGTIFLENVDTVVEQYLSSMSNLSTIVTFL
jgi:hypothetical protein